MNRCGGVSCYFLFSPSPFDDDNVAMISDNDTRSLAARNSRRTLLKYCACAWALPAVVVVTCFALDYTDTIAIGYGKR